MKFKKERLLDMPMEMFLKLFMENENPPYDMSTLENVTQWKIVREKDDGDKLIGTKEWCAHAQIPKALQHIVTPKTLTWYEHSEWNRKTSVYSFRIEPFYLKNKVVCHGKTSYSAQGDKTKRVFELLIDVKIPVFGQMFESIVITLLGKNEEQDYHICQKVCRKALQESGA